MWLRTGAHECRKEPAEYASAWVLGKPTWWLMAVGNPLFPWLVEVAALVSYRSLVHYKLVHDAQAIKPVVECKCFLAALEWNIKHARAVLHGSGCRAGGAKLRHDTYPIYRAV